MPADVGIVGGYFTSFFLPELTAMNSSLTLPRFSCKKRQRTDSKGVGSALGKAWQSAPRMGLLAMILGYSPYPSEGHISEIIWPEIETGFLIGSPHTLPPSRQIIDSLTDSSQYFPITLSTYSLVSAWGKYIFAPAGISTVIVPLSVLVRRGKSVQSISLNFGAVASSSLIQVTRYPAILTSSW